MLAGELESLRQLSYRELVGRLLDRVETREVTLPSGAWYQLEIQGFWDSRPNEVLRVLGAIDDGKERASIPLTDDFLIASDGSFVGEPLGQ